MKRFFKFFFKFVFGVFVGLGVLGLTGCVATMFLVGTTIEVVDETIQEVEQEGIELSNTYNDLVQAIEWTVVTDSWGDTTVTGILENTTDEVIDYIEIEYEFVKDGITVDSSFTNETDIEPNEKVKIEIITFEEFDTFTVKGSDGWN